MAHGLHLRNLVVIVIVITIIIRGAILIIIYVMTALSGHFAVILATVDGCIR